MTELIAVPAGQPRLQLLIKAKIAHQAGYYLLNGRWHSIHQHKPAPKGVPVAAHPKAAHAEHVKPFPLPDDQVAALKLPPENVNSGTYNKQLDNLLGYAANGDATAILGMNLGTNTYGKKLAKVANYLLDGMGVADEYKVAPGQKAGEHHAVSVAPAPFETPASIEPAVAAAVVEAPAEPEKPEFQSYPSTGPLAMPDFVEGKETTGVVEYYQKQAMKVIDAAESGAADELAQMEVDGTTPNSKGKISNTWAGKTPNSKKFLALYANAVESLGGAPAATVVTAPVEPPAEPKTDYLEKIENASSASSAMMFANLHHAQNGYSDQAQAEANVALLSQANKAKLDAAPVAVPEPEPAPVDVPAPVSSASDLLGQIPWEKLSSPETKGDGTPNKEGINANKKLATIKAAAEAGDIAALEGMKFGVNTYGKKLTQAKAIALAALEDTPAAPAPVAEVPPVVTEPVTPTLAMQLADAGIMGKMAVAEQHVVKNGKSPETYKQIADAHASLGNDEAAEHWNIKASDLIAVDKLSDDIKAAGSVTAATKIAVVHVISNKHSPKSGEQAIEALKAHGYDKAADAIKMGMEDVDKVAESMPAKPADLTGHFDLAYKVEDAHANGDKAALAEAIDLSDGAPADSNLGKVNAYAKQALAHIEAAGPKDGDTKPGANGGTLVFQDGRWHKQDEPVAPVADVHPLDAVPMPDFSGLMPSTQTKVTNALQLLKEQAKVEGAGAFTGVLKKMSASGKLITKLKGDFGSFKVVGFDHSPDHKWSQVHQYVEDLKAAAGGKKAKPKAAPAPATVAVDPTTPPAMDDWKQIGPQAGSNAGGKFVDQNGTEWYCKFPGNDDVAKSEVLAAKLYGAAGIAGQDAMLVTKDGKLGIASKWTDVNKVPPAALAKADGVASGFAVDAWLGNWDVVGLEFDNLQLGADGKAVRIDAGGSLEYRAQGGKKTFGDSVLEIDSLRDAKINPQAAKVFGKLSQADITASVAKVLKVGDAQIYELVNTYGPGTSEDKKKLAETLIARKADLLAKYPKAKKKKVITFKPEKISEPPSFMNWGGGGKSGPSSKEFLNEANEKAVQSIYTAAKTGDAEAVKNLSAYTFNKDTGDITGSAPVLEHPSQHVKGYAQQALNEIHHQMNPPKRFRFEGGHPLHSLNSAYPSHKGPPHSDAVEKVGKFLMLGSPGTLSLDTLALPKKTYASGALTKATYSPAARSAIKQMPETQKQAIKSYTGSGYGNMNGSLWTGNPTGAAKAAGEALHALGHEIEPGTVLSRKLSVHGEALDQILKASGKVLQEPAIMSTSIRPSSWSGNVHLKLHVGPGVKGLWVGPGSTSGNGALSLNAGEDELILPPNTRLLILSVKNANGGDADGFGSNSQHIVEAVILPTQQAGA